MTKILYLVTQSELGGAQRYIFDLASQLSKQGYEITVAAGGNQELFTKMKQHNIQTYQLKNLIRQINPIKDLLAYFEIKKLLKKIQPDVLHLNSSKAGVLGSIAGKHCGVKKIIYTVHGFVFNEPMPDWKKQLYRSAEKFSAGYKNKLICVSEFDRQTGIKNKIALPEKLITIHNGVSSATFLEKQQARNLLNLPNDKLIIGIIANLYPTKGLLDLVKSANEINKKISVLFVVIGEGEQRQILEAEIKKLGLENNFILLGQKDEASQLLKAFDIYICSSVKEGFPYSILEAMQAELPIITTNVGGIPEMIENNISGLLINPADPQALIAAIDKLITNKNLAEQLGHHAQLRVNQNFDLAKMIETTKKIYLTNA